MTEEMKHAPGPFYVDMVGRSIDPLIVDGEGRTLAKVYTVSGDGPTDNAPLFAAAPDLLAALETAHGALLYAYEREHDTMAQSRYGEALDEARAAIAKATADA